MKYAGRGGHNSLCEGANALVNEVIEDRKIFYASKKYISLANTFIDVTPIPVAGQNNDLNYGIGKANDSKVDIFYSVHLNKSYDAYDGEMGSEIWLQDKNSKLIPQATRVLKNLELLGFKNRGIKFASVENKKLAELRCTKMPAMIIECFFLEATKDVALYKKLGPDILGKAIAEGILGHSIENTGAAPVKSAADTSIYKTVTATTLNVRSGPGTNFAKIGNLNKDDKVKIDKILSNGWTSIYFGNHGGYVSTQYLK